MTFLTSFFLHADILHLVGNMYLLLAFGGGVEDYLSRKRFGLLLIAATLAGGLGHTILDPHSNIPLIGASGGISGIITFYALQFPRSRLGFFIQYRWGTIPVWGAFIL